MKNFFSKRKVKDFIMLNIGIIMTAFCLVLVFEPNGAVFGGVAGLGIVLHNFTVFSYFYSHNGDIL